MSIQDEQELASLRAVGRIVRMVLEAMKAEVRPGVTTRYLDGIGARVSFPMLRTHNEPPQNRNQSTGSERP